MGIASTRIKNMLFAVLLGVSILLTPYQPANAQIDVWYCHNNSLFLFGASEQAACTLLYEASCDLTVSEFMNPVFTDDIPSGTLCSSCGDWLSANALCERNTAGFRGVGFSATNPQCPLATGELLEYDTVNADGTCGCSSGGTTYPSNGPSGDPKGCGELAPPAGKDDGKSCGVGNPCNPATGNKFQSETDFASNGFSFTRSYNSHNLANLGLGKGWRSNYQKALYVSADSLTQVSGTGRGEPWSKVGGNWQGDADSDFLISEDTSGFQLTGANGAIEIYDLSGVLLSEIDTNGFQTVYTYTVEGDLQQVANDYGHTISFTYINGMVNSVTDSFGVNYRYEYDANDNLVAVVMPDTTPADDLDNPRRIYHYEDVGYPNHLTGITDENGDRFATYSYDVDGKAITTEHATTTNAVGQERFELDYQGGAQ
jgi:YD repeat-containing protein